MKINDDVFNKKIKPLFANAVFTSVATVNAENQPHVSPIGSVYMLNKNKGFYFEKFTKNIGKNATQNSLATLMSVNVGRWYWLKSLLTGQFKTPPAIRILVKLGELRDGTESEMKLFQRRVSLFKKTKGYDKLWKEMSMVREFTVIEYKPVYIGPMTKEQFQMT
jgi:hypothetical protein